MSFGLCNAPGTFQKTMDYIFQNMRQFAGVYIDDILIYTKTLEDHLQALRKVYDKLRQGSIFSRPDKCTWAQPEVEYRGLILGRHGITPQPGKLLEIRHCSLSSSVTDVWRFLGLCGLYQRFVADYETVATLPTDLMQKDKEWAWLQVQQHEFETLKARLLQTHVLVHHGHTKPYMLHTDASDVGVGATLSKLDAER